MEPNKFEEEIRNKLNEREIQPSAAAWTKLEGMLSDEDKPRRRFPWWYVAASVLGFLLVGTALFNKFDSVKININTPVVLEQKIDEDVLEEKNVNHKEILLPKIYEKKLHKGVAVSDIQSKQQIPIKSQREVVNLNQASDTAIILSNKKNEQSVSTYKYVSPEKLLAQVSDSKFEIKESKKIEQKTKRIISVDPNALLSDVESELNQSYRESALDRLNKKFNVIKTVLVNRNYEE